MMFVSIGPGEEQLIKIVNSGDDVEERDVKSKILSKTVTNV